MKTDDLSRLTELAFQYGPFFFSILFLLVVTRWASGAYSKVRDSKAPGSSQEQSTYRWIFVASFVVGILLVGASVWWWWQYRPAEYVYTGEIKNLKDYETITSDSLYFRSQPRPSMPGDPYKLRNEFFAVVQNQPFHTGQEFEFDFSKGESKRNTFKVKYVPNTHPEYSISWDEAAKDNVLQSPQSAVSHRFRLPGWETVAYAAEEQAVQAEAPPELHMSKIKALPHSAVDTQLLLTLQNPRSDVGSKIVAVDKLNAMDAPTLKRYLDTDLGTEPVAVTILDLTRNTDKELAYKSSVLAKKAGVNEYVASQLTSPNKDTRAKARMALERIDNKRSQEIIQLTAAKQQNQQPVTAAVNREKKVLLPTATAQGDRYYVKATWDPANGNTVACLAKLFNTELDSNRSLDQEKQLMAGMRERVVYWYAKDWTLSISQKIQQCGGQATFIQPTMQK